jgi:hypothetical protein
MSTATSRCDSESTSPYTRSQICLHLLHKSYYILFIISPTLLLEIWSLNYIFEHNFWKSTRKKSRSLNCSEYCQDLHSVIFITPHFFIRAFMTDVTYLTVLDVLTLQSWSGFTSLYIYIYIYENSKFFQGTRKS